MKSSNEEDYEAKEKVFYNAMISAWLNTKLERDKQLLGLSVTAIGLLVTLLRVGVSDSLQIVFFGLALICFLITVISVIWILGENATHINNMLNGSEAEAESKVLDFLDKFAIISFVFGMILVVLIGMYSAAVNLNLGEKGKIMSQEKSPGVNDSWNGVAKLRPQPPKKEVQTDPNTPTSNPSTTSEVNRSNNTGKTGSGN